MVSFDARRKVGSFWRSYMQFWPPSLGKLYILPEDNEPGRRVVDCVGSISTDVKQFVNASLMTEHAASVESAYLHRQLWKFFLDEYTTSPIIAIFDDDACLVTQVVRRHFVNNGSLVARGLSMPDYKGRWSDATELVLGRPQVADFMVDFPILLWREMFPLIRAHIINRFRGEIDTALPERLQLAQALDVVKQKHGMILSEFNLMMNYAWHSASWRDRYTWNFAPSQELMPGHVHGAIQPIVAFSIHTHGAGCPSAPLELEEKYMVYPRNMELSFDSETGRLLYGLTWLKKFENTFEGWAAWREYWQQADVSTPAALAQIKDDIAALRASGAQLSVTETRSDAIELLGPCMP